MTKRHIGDDAPARMGTRVVAKGMFRGELSSVTGWRFPSATIEKLAFREEYFPEIFLINI
jgi:hypothetical protein